MNNDRLRHRLALAAIVLAWWATDATAGIACGVGAASSLFDMSIEELMELPIDLTGANAGCPGDLIEAPVLPAITAGVCLGSDNSRTSDKCRASQTSTILDHVDYER